MNLPKGFLQRMQGELRENFPAFCACYEEPPVKGLRVNTLKLSPEAFRARAPFPLGDYIPWAKGGFYTEGERLGADPYHFAGLYYLQEPSAMCAVPLLEVKKGERVLDLCAAPGGKTTQLASDMGGTGVLVANEIDYGRACILRENLVRMGVTNAIVTGASPQKLADVFPAYFDKILVDAPCSGEGMFRKEEGAALMWSPASVAGCAARQRDILDAAAGMLAGGGRMVYSTCTFAREEDELQVEAFLARHPEFTLLEMKKLYPHEVKGEGHFAAVLQKAEGERAPRPVLPKFSPAKGYNFDPPGAAGAWKAFSEEFFETVPQGELRVQGMWLYLAEGLPQFDYTRVVNHSIGVAVGEWDRKRFKPAHALAMAYGKYARRKLVLTREEVKKYLRGEALPCDLKDGWCCVTVEEFPVGLAKVTGGIAKNHLPKPLRLRTSD